MEPDLKLHAEKMKAVNDTRCSKGLSSYSLGVIFSTMGEVKQYKREVTESPSSKEKKKKENLPRFDLE